MSGFVPSLGAVSLDGHNISKLPVHQRVRAGLARTWQSSELFDDLTVMENLRVATECGSRVDGSGKAPLKSKTAIGKELEAAAELLGLAQMLEKFPTELSHGQRKLVGVARALVSRPRILMLDEPAAGLDSAESAELGVQLRGMVDEGATLLLIDHDMGLVLTVCDYIYVINFGQLLAEGTPSQIRDDERVIAAYLGDREVSASPGDGSGEAVSEAQL
jgi:branched-chain amino acid transport system ATP-binding protein